MNPFYSIKGKLIIFILCTSLIPVIVVTIIYYINAKNSLKKIIRQEMLAVVESKKLHVLSFIEAKKSRTVDFSSDGLIRNSHEEIIRNESLKENTVIRLNQYLIKNKKTIDPDILAITTVDPDGRVVASTHGPWIGKDISNQDEFIQAVSKGDKEAYVGQCGNMHSLDANAFCISAPLISLDGKGTTGVIIIVFNLSAINEITDNRIGMGESGEVVLGRKVEDDIVFLNSLRYAPDAALSLSAPLDSNQAKPMRLALEGNNGIIIAPDYRGVYVVAAYQYIRSMDWGIVAKIDRAEVYAPLRALAAVAVIVAGVSVALITCLGTILASSVSRPIIELTDATKRFAAGDLAHRVKINRKDEIGVLAVSYNVMADELSKETYKLSCAIEQSPASVIITDTKGNIEYVNPQFTKTTGYSLSEVIGKNSRILKSGEQSYGMYTQMWSTITAGYEWRGTFCNRKKNGDLFWELLSISPVKNSRGDITNFVGVKIDDTERRMAEERLRKSEARFSGILDIAEDAIISIDERERIIIFNKGAEVIFGYNRKDVIGRPIDVLVPERFRNDHHNHIKKFADSTISAKRMGARPYQIIGLKNNGEEFFAEASISQLMEKSGKIFTLALRDVTAQKKLEDNLLEERSESNKTNKELKKAYSELKASHAIILHQEKMASIGQLAAGVAHEINNPIGYISSNLGTLGHYVDRLAEFINIQGKVIMSNNSKDVIESLDKKRNELKLDYILNDIKGLVKESLDGAGSVANIVRNLKGYARHGEEKPVDADINECIKSSLSIVWNELKYKAAVKEEYGKIPLTRCFPQHLNQVFVNILINAAHAIHEYGEITIKTRHEEDYIFMSISDTGCGIPEKNLSKIFDPFFTTKEVGKGTGLGMSISYDIVKKHDGDIKVESEVGKGTTFTIKIPIVG